MLVSREEIIKYLKSVPPVPESVQECLKYLKEGNLRQAALAADKDIVLKKQIEGVVNSAYFSLPNKVEDTVQLFSMIGLEMARNLVYSYLVTLLAPKEWEIFESLNFRDFQANFLNLYEKYATLEFGEKIYKEYAILGAMIPSAVCVIDALLGDKKSQLQIITESAPIEIGTLLKRLTGVTLFGISAKIAGLWEVDKKFQDVLMKAECIKCDNKIAALLHFIFFYLASKPQFIELNSLIEFNTDCVKFVPKTYERILNGS